MMRFDRVRAPLRAELRRALPALLRGLVPLAVVLLVLVVARRSVVTTFAFGAATGLAVAAMTVPMLVFRDRERGLSPLRGALPVDGKAFVSARFLAVLILTLPWAALLAGAAWRGAQGAASVDNAGMVGIATAIVAWLAASMVGWTGTALLVRYSLSTVVLLPLTAAVVAATAWEILFPSAFHRAETFVAPNVPHDQAILVGIVVAVAGLAVAVAATAFESTTRGLAASPREPLAS